MLSWSCALHEGCSHRLRVVTTLSNIYVLEECGQHAVGPLLKPKSGIYLGLTDEVDTLLRSGGVPKKILDELKRKYNEHSPFFYVLPTVLQIQNRSRTIEKTGLHISSGNDLLNFFKAHKVCVVLIAVAGRVILLNYVLCARFVLVSLFWCQS